MIALAFFDSPKDWLVVLLILVVLFGSAKIPELARSLGRAKAEFQKASREAEASLKESQKTDEKPIVAATQNGAGAK